MKVSIVVPLYNELDNVEPLITRLGESVKDFDYELVLVDDGSSDGTPEKVLELADERVRLIRFRRNFGQTAAMAAGIDEAVGDLIVTIDGDLQNNPEDIPLMIEKLENEGWDIVAGRRAKRKDGFILRKIPSKIANALIRKMTGVYISDYGCTLKVFRKDIAKQLDLYGELHRFIPVLASMKGAKITEMDVRHSPRIHGQSKYGIGRTTRVISDLSYLLFVQQYGQRPMHFFGLIGFLSLFIGLGIDFYLLILKLFGQDIWGRPLLILGMVLTIGGIQLVTTGFIAELLTRTYYESQNKKPYVIRNKYRGRELDEKDS